MLLDQFEKQCLFFYSNFKEATSAGGLMAYRGGLVLVEGDIIDAQWRKSKPLVMLDGAVILADTDKIKLLAGTIDELDHLQIVLDKYAGYFTQDTRVVLYVVNIGEPMQVEVAGVNIILIPMVDGLVWNELVDELRLQKSDFKGQSSADKLVTVFDAFKGYRPKYEKLTLEEAHGRTIVAQRVDRGPV
jgi:hypothetical protein